jgi:hypothetical protein
MLEAARESSENDTDVPADSIERFLRNRQVQKLLVQLDTLQSGLDNSSRLPAPEHWFLCVTKFLGALAQDNFEEINSSLPVKNRF